MIENWTPVEQGLLSRRTVGFERIVALAPGQDPERVKSSLIMEIYNLLISEKLDFEKRDMPPLNMELRYSRKDLLFVYSIFGGRLLLLALAMKGKGGLEGVRLVLTPARVAGSREAGTVRDLLERMASPYSVDD